MKTVRENTVESWQTAIEDALDYRLKYGREKQWGALESLFYHAHEMQGGDKLGPNLISSTGDALLSALTVPNPFFLIEPLRLDTVDAAPVLESQLNTLLYALKIRSEMETSVNHAYLYGRGIIKLGYDSEFGYEPDLDLGQEVNQVFGMSLTQFSKKGTRIEFNDFSPGMPWVKSVMPHDFLVPYGVRDLRSAPWTAERIIRHIDDIQADPKYENKSELKATMTMSDYTKSYLQAMNPYRMGATETITQSQAEGHLEYVEMWEIHDTRTSRVYVIAPGHDKFLRNEIDYLQLDNQVPYVSFSFVPTSRTFWVTPDALYLFSAQTEAIDIATMAQRQRRISTLRILYEEGAIDLDEMEKFMSGEIGIGIKYKNATSNGQVPITAMTPTNNNNMLQMESEQVRRDAREMVGFGRNQMGEYEGTGRRTATEASVVQQKSEQRLDRRQLAVADAYCEIGRKLSKIIFQFWRTPRLTQILGEQGAVQWTTFTGSELRGEYQYKVGFSNEPIETRQSREDKAISLFQGLAADPTINQIELRRYLARAFNNPAFNRLFLPGVLENANLSNALPQPGVQSPVGGPAGQGAPGGGGASRPVSKVPNQRSAGVQQQQRQRAGVGQ